MAPTNGTTTRKRPAAQSEEVRYEDEAVAGVELAVTEADAVVASKPSAWTRPGENGSSRDDGLLRHLGIDSEGSNLRVGDVVRVIHPLSARCDREGVIVVASSSSSQERDGDDAPDGKGEAAASASANEGVIVVELLLPSSSAAYDGNDAAAVENEKQPTMDLIEERFRPIHLRRIYRPDPSWALAAAASTSASAGDEEKRNTGASSGTSALSSRTLLDAWEGNDADNLDGIIQEAAKITRRDPSSPDGHVLMGYCSLNASKVCYCPTMAAACFVRALRLSEDILRNSNKMELLQRRNEVGFFDSSSDSPSDDPIEFIPYVRARAGLATSLAAMEMWNEASNEATRRPALVSWGLHAASTTASRGGGGRGGEEELGAAAAVPFEYQRRVEEKGERATRERAAWALRVVHWLVASNVDNDATEELIEEWTSRYDACRPKYKPSDFAARRRTARTAPLDDGGSDTDSASSEGSVEDVGNLKTDGDAEDDDDEFFAKTFGVEQMNEADDAALAFTRVLTIHRTGRQPGNRNILETDPHFRAALETRLFDALEVNQYVTEYLLMEDEDTRKGGHNADGTLTVANFAGGGGGFGSGAGLDVAEPGSRSEAMRYVSAAGSVWADAGALDWLAEGLADFGYSGAESDVTSTSGTGDVAAQSTSDFSRNVSSRDESLSTQGYRRSVEENKSRGSRRRAQRVPKRRKPVWYSVVQDPEFRKLLGDCVSNDDNGDDDEGNGTFYGAERAENPQSFRSSISSLPFAIKFQLERLLFDQKCNVPTYVAKQPQRQSLEGQDRAKDDVATKALLLLELLVTRVVPLLNRVDWAALGRLHRSNMTLNELFADEIWNSLKCAKEATGRGDPPMFDDTDIHVALKRAIERIKNAERTCRTTESQLDAPSSDSEYIHVVQKRSMWPKAEYRVEFNPDGQLVPLNLEIKDASNSSMESRRAFREAGWYVRDRFVKTKPIQFEHGLDVTDCLIQKPRMCGRTYEYLADKGPGRPSIWLFASSAELDFTRDDFLASLGDFSGVTPSKVGDRISLAFTTTVPVLHLKVEENIVAIPEVTRNGYRFSDGCGVMGMEVAQTVQRVLRLTKLPGAMQIRMGGVKGMLSLKRDFPPNQIGIRPSMVKFPSTHTILEVKSVAGAPSGTVGPGPGHVNIFSQALLVMEHLRVSDQTFYDLQFKAFARVFCSEYDRGAAEWAKARGNGEYYSRVVDEGLKSNGERFSPAELSGVKSSITAAEKKVNLPISGTLLKGVCDEHDILEEGELLVGNGSIVGDVLIFRSPCGTPGDLQRATAVKAIGGEPFVYLNDAIVFSAKGSRPLADMLAGGDYDGDEFFVVDEKALLAELRVVEPSDYGSQSSTYRTRVDIRRCFPDRRADSAAAPNATVQIGQLRDYFALGDLVSESSDAWERVADEKGVVSDEAIDMAQLKARALDARKGGIEIDDDQINRMKYILGKCRTPDWACPESKYARPSTSLLGYLYKRWAAFSQATYLVQKRMYFKDEIDLARAEEERKQRQKELTFLERLRKNEREMRSMRIDKGPVPGSICVRCGRVCQGRCGQLGEPNDGVLNSGAPIDAHANARERALNVVFGQNAPSHADFNEINWESLQREDLAILADMALREFSSELRAEINESKTWTKENGGKEKAHVFDICILDGNIKSDGKPDLLVCLPARRSGPPVFVDGDRREVPMNPSVKVRRISSLSGVLRILESLMQVPVDGTLMYAAMTRERLVEAVPVHENAISGNQEIMASLNQAQRQAVATALSPDFTDGFFVVQGPPGTGKTSTLVGIISGIGDGAIVTAPSNAAVANIALKLFVTGRFRMDSLVVVGEKCDESVQFLNPMYRGKKYRSFLATYNSLQSDEEKEAQRRQMCNWLKVSLETSLQELSTLCPQIDEDGGQFEKYMIASASIVFCTLNRAGSSSLRKAVQSKFHTILLDEAGQCTEAEFYIATTFPYVRRIIVVGDPRQLPATVIDDRCREAGYGDSWMSRVMQYHPEKVHLLDMQYRMDPGILSFSNATFYSNRVQSAEFLISRRPRVDVPFCFISTGMVGFLEGNQEIMHRTSWRNPYEAYVVKHLLHVDGDIRNILKARSPTKPRIIVISPYKAQVELIKEELQNETRFNIDVATVDSFQGQEGEVVILSTVRTNRAGFVDDSQRINVSLTRAKRVLRVVGQINFFSNLERGSTLRKLAEYAEREGCCDSQHLKALKTKSRKFAWKPPDWSRGTLWKPTMTQKFHHCIRGMGSMDKNVSLNTLLEVSTPNMNNLSSFPNTKAKTWQTSSLKDYESRVNIVWVPKEGIPRPTIEAHFAGTKRDCNNFRQTHPLVPKGTCYVRHGLQGIRIDRIDTGAQSEQIDTSWLVSNEISNAIVWDEIDGLPEGCFMLDPEQERVVQESPPLLLESRSGTGKTNVLFQHAVKHAKDSLIAGQSDVLKPICFVTVSPRLRRELYKRYDEIQGIEDAKLPIIKFFSFKELLGKLVQACQRNKSMRIEDTCCFADYLNSRRSHQSLSAEPSLVENEIGGVIMGSLEAALNRAPLTREKYVEEKRSNIPNSTREGRTTRHHVYDVYSDYKKWKGENNKIDVNDVILYLIKADLKQIFSSAYLDEIQDFSYAAIYLICRIGGHATLHWVCAGDTAQMISPGCSFTFDGLKQTMLAVSPGIQQRLKKVTHLARNYRTTKAVLDTGNAILDVAKKYFPDAIEYARPETAVKDLRIKVALVSWQDVLSSSAMFGPNQALIYTSLNSSESLVNSLNNWLKNHPFVLSSLESKGLEFDDVMVAFDVERKLWNVSAKQIASLRLLRELYVAVTRAKRRVVILVHKKVDAMVNFFTDLECNIEFEEPSTILVEFNDETSEADWFKKGMELFEDEQFRIAAGCFKAGQKLGWASWSQGRHEKALGQQSEAVASFRSGARYFYEDADYEHSLDLIRLIIDIPPWQKEDNFILEGAQRHCPDYFTREEWVKINLSRGAWQRISVDDLSDVSLASVFLAFRKREGIMRIIGSCTREDREMVASTLPNLVGDYFLKEMNYVEATKLFITGRDYACAKEATSAALKAAKSSGDAEPLADIASYWDHGDGALREAADYEDVKLLVLLFLSPQKAASSHAENCMQRFNANIIKSAVKRAGLDTTHLHDFDKNKFHKPVLEALTRRFRDNKIDIPKWFIEHNDKKHALDFVNTNMKRWSNEELTQVLIKELKLRPKGLIQEFLRRQLPLSDLKHFLDSSSEDVDIAIDITDQALGSVQKSKKNMDDILSVWNPKKTKMQVRTSLVRRSTSRTAIFLDLFEKPAGMSRTNPRQCMDFFGAVVVKKAVLSGGLYGSTSEVMAIFRRFSKRAFESIPQLEIEAVTRQRRQEKQNTRPARAESEGRSSQQNTFSEGDRVELHSLKEEDLNGQHGTVTRDKFKSGRYPVRLDGDMKEKSVRPQNLRLLVADISSGSEEGDDSDDDVPPLQLREDSHSSEDSDSSSSSDSASMPPSHSQQATGEKSELDSDSSESMPPLDEGNSSSDDSDSNSDSDDSDMPSLVDPNHSSSSDSE